LLVACAAFAGCAPDNPSAGPAGPSPRPGAATDGNAPEPPAQRYGPWRPLFDGRSTRPWVAVRGDADVETGQLILTPDDEGKGIWYAPGVRFRDGQIEVTFRYLGNEPPPGAFTVSGRVYLHWHWTSVYFVLWPDKIEICRAGHRNPNPRDAAGWDLPAPPTPLHWRFTLDGQQVSASMIDPDAPDDPGELIAQWIDPKPNAGSISLTVDRCRVAIESIRYREAIDD
jgi:hypothetical protein